MNFNKLSASCNILTIIINNNNKSSQSGAFQKVKFNFFNHGEGIIIIINYCQNVTTGRQFIKIHVTFNK